MRAAGDSGPLLCWLATPGAPWAELVEADVEVTASSADQLEEILALHTGRDVAQVHEDILQTLIEARYADGRALTEDEITGLLASTLPNRDGQRMVGGEGKAVLIDGRSGEQGGRRPRRGGRGP